MKKLRGYIFSRVFFEERVPQNVQNLVIRDYCNKASYQYLLSSVEYAMSGSNLMLNSISKDIKNIEGIVFYSYFQLPEIYSVRKKLYKNIFSKKKSLHFALENTKISSILEANDIDEILTIKKFMIKSSFTDSIKNFYFDKER